MPYVTGSAEPGRDVGAAAANFPDVNLVHHEPTPGDTPMTRTWKTLALASLLVAASPTFAPAGGADPDAKALQKSIEQLRKSVEALSKKVDNTPVAMTSKEVLTEINRLEKTLVGKIEKASKDLNTQISAIKEEQLLQKIELQKLPGLSKRVQTLEVDVMAIGDDVRKLQRLLEAMPAPGIGGTERKSFSPPTTSNFGRVMLTNLYSVPMLFVVNGRTHVVDPGATTQLMNMPVGAMTYEVFADGYGFIRRTTTAVEPNQTVMITVR
jgi:hypothetical protein